MNILHVWDQSGVACILSKYQKKCGHNATVLRRSNYDPYGIYEYYRDLVDFVDEKDYFDSCIHLSKNADIIHIHSRSDALLHLRKKLGPKIKIIMHFHGSDLRGVKQKYSELNLISIPKTIFKTYQANKIRKSNNLFAMKSANRIILSTPDLLDGIQDLNPLVLNNPVDIEHFCRNQEKRLATNNRCFTFLTEATSDTKWIVNYCKHHGINEMKVVDRIRNPIRYSEMPAFLSKFDTYVDVRYVNNRLLENLSKTALESLACGLEVIDYRMKKLSKLPAQNDPKIVANKVLEIYEDIT